MKDKISLAGGKTLDVLEDVSNPIQLTIGHYAGIDDRFTISIEGSEGKGATSVYRTSVKITDLIQDNKPYPIEHYQYYVFKVLINKKWAEEIPEYQRGIFTISLLVSECI